MFRFLANQLLISYTINKLLIEKVRKEIILTTKQLQKVVGTSEIEKQVEIKISFEKDQQFAKLTGQIAFVIFSKSSRCTTSI
jgi:hypothetical protein